MKGQGFSAQWYNGRVEWTCLRYTLWEGINFDRGPEYTTYLAAPICPGAQNNAMTFVHITVHIKPLRP